MSRNDDTGRDSRGDNVETSIEITVEDGDYRLEPRIANYEQFDVAARVSFPLPDSLDTGQPSSLATQSDVWSIEDGKLVLIDRVEWAGTADWAHSIEMADRSDIKALVEGAMVELTDMDGDEVAVRSDIQTEFPPERSTAETRPDPDRSDSKPETPDTADIGEEDGGTAADPDTADDESGNESDGETAETRSETPDRTRSQTDEMATGRMSRQTESNRSRPEEPSENSAEAPGKTETEPTDQHDSAVDDDGQPEPGRRKMPEPSPEFPLDPPTDQDANSGPADAASTAFDWVEVPPDTRTPESDSREPEPEDEDSETETRDVASDDQGSSQVSQGSDGVLGRFRSLFSE